MRTLSFTPDGELALGETIIDPASPDTIAVATEATGGNGTWTSRVLVTTDGGRHWDVAATDVQGFGGAGNAPAWIGFETPLSGPVADQIRPSRVRCIQGDGLADRSLHSRKQRG